MKDASELVDAIKLAVAGRKTLRKAITDYELEMKPRGAKEVSLSLEQALSASDLRTLKDSPIFKVGWRPSVTAQVGESKS